MRNREAEIARYIEAYKDPAYKLGRFRRPQVEGYLSDLTKGSYLDVGTGRGEVLDIAATLGYSPVQGVDPVDLGRPDVVQAIATDLPFDDDSFDVVSMFDVLEHLVEEDVIPALKELLRVASRHVVVTAHTRADKNGYHITIKSMDEWHSVMQSIHPARKLDASVNPVSGGWCFDL